MQPDDIKQLWQAPASHGRTSIDSHLLLQQLRRADACFRAMIIWRDVREIGTCIVLVPLWVYLGVKNASPFSWYLTIPALLWIAGYMLVNRIIQRRRTAAAGESLRERVKSSMSQVEHQIWLLRNVHLWCLFPLSVAQLSFVGQVAWQERFGGWWTALGATIVVTVGLSVLILIYRLNQYVVRVALQPRFDELRTLLVSLEDAPQSN